MHLDKLIDLGAEAVGGVVYLNRVNMGSFTAEGFVLSEAGQTYFQASAEPEPVEAVEPAAPKRKAKAKVEAVEPGAPEITAEELSGLDDLIQ